MSELEGIQTAGSLKFHICSSNKILSKNPVGKADTGELVWVGSKGGRRVEAEPNLIWPFSHCPNPKSQGWDVPKTPPFLSWNINIQTESQVREVRTEIQEKILALSSVSHP